MKIKGKAVRLWVIPAYDVVAIDIDTPDFGQDMEAPF